MTTPHDFAALCLLSAECEALKKSVFTGAHDKNVLRAVGVLRLLGGKTHLQIETFTADGKARHENLPLTAEGQARLAQIAAGFTRINLLTTAGDAELKENKKGERVFLGADKLRRKLEAGVATSVAVIGNNKVKKRILSGDEPFLKLLGVSDENGRVYDKKGAKFRQINRFLELIRDTLDYLPKDKIRICDLCCGKSYLSFAVYYYFAVIRKRKTVMIGVDMKADVVDDCNRIARQLNMDGLSFVAADITLYEFGNGEDGDPTDIPPYVDMVISLHACDTATDMVLDKASSWGAKVILSTPCCHHELNKKLNCKALGFIAEHSMLRQKLCDAATDALRLCLLRSRGYDVAALELIDPEETPKNILLRGILKYSPTSPRALRALEEYNAARAFLLGEE